MCRSALLLLATVAAVGLLTVMQMLAKDQLLGRYGQLLSSFCHLKRSLELPQALLGAALLALSQLMAVDMTYCANNIALLFTLLIERCGAAEWRVRACLRQQMSCVVLILITSVCTLQQCCCCC